MNTRVEIPAYTDMWMRGARFGTVIATSTSRLTRREIWTVQLDHQQVRKPHKFLADDCRVL